MENHFGRVFNGIKVAGSQQYLVVSLLLLVAEANYLSHTQEAIPCFYVPSQPALSRYWPPLNARQQQHSVWYHQSISILYISRLCASPPTDGFVCVSLLHHLCFSTPLSIQLRIFVACMCAACHFDLYTLSWWCMCIDTLQFKHLLCATAAYSITCTAELSIAREYLSAN